MAVLVELDSTWMRLDAPGEIAGGHGEGGKKEKDSSMVASRSRKCHCDVTG